MSSKVITVTPVILEEEKDWLPWIEVIRTAAGDLWDFVNPSVPLANLKTLEEPIEPTPATVKAVTTPSSTQTNTLSNTPSPDEPEVITFASLSSSEQNHLQMLQSLYLHKLKTYDSKVKAMNELRAKVQQTISRANLQYTRGCDTVQEMLEKLKRRFAPSDKARQNEVARSWQRAVQRPKRGTAVTTWLSELETAYDEAVEYKLPEVQGLHAHYALTAATVDIDSSFSHDWDRQLLRFTEEDPLRPRFRDMVQELRELKRLQASRQPSSARHGAFAASLQDLDSNGKPVKRKCLCDEFHLYRTCPYLIPERRPAGWKPNHSIQKKVDDLVAAMQPHDRRLFTIRRAQEQARNSTTPNPTELPGSSGTANNKNQGPGPKASMMVYRTSIQPIKSGSFNAFHDAETSSGSDYPLGNSVILDSGSTCNIGNTKSRFDPQTLRTPREGEERTIYAGDALVPIKSYGTMSVTVQTEGFPNGRVITFRDTPYVPSLHTSIVSLKFLNDRGIYWSNRSNTLECEDSEGKRVHWADTPTRFEQWVLEYTENSALQWPRSEGSFATLLASFKAHSSRAPRPIKEGTLDQWHEIMGHLYPEALKKLETACQGVKITTSSLSDPKCETCYLNDSKSVPYRHPTLRHPIPFWKLCWDLISMDNGLGGENHMLHFVCPTSRMHFVYHLLGTGKQHLLPCFEHVLKYVKRRYGLKVQIFHGDGEPTVQYFDEFKIEHGLIMENSPPHTQAQNGDAERSGGVIMGRGRNMRTSANLPEVLWPEIYSAAAYLLNRSPTRSLGWLTPIGFVEKYLGNPVPRPSLNHLVPYGCRAYSFIKNMPKHERRLNHRAHIGYCVGYGGSNVYRIWIPKLKTVISTRDVVFDVTKRYNPDDDQSEAPVEVIQVLEIISPEIDETVDDWETMPPLRSFETTIESHGDTVVVDAPLSAPKTSVGTLPTPRETPDFEQPPTITQSLNQPTDGSPGTSSTLATAASQSDVVDLAQTTLGVELSSSDRLGVDLSSTLGPKSTNVPDSSSTRDSPRRRHATTSKPPPTKPPRGFVPPEQEARKGVNRGVASSNIVEGKRNRKAAFTIKQLFWDLTIYPTSTYYSSFLAGTTFQEPKLRIRDLPAPPKKHRELDTHPYGARFKQEQKVEYDTLWDKGTFKSVPITDATSFILPLMWVFSYKGDEDGFLSRCKARLVVRGDLQKNHSQDTYAATLAARVFRALMAIAAYFDLDTQQFDAVNAFCNAFLDEEVYVRYPDGYQEPGHCLQLIRALYGLPKSPLLWYNLMCEYLRKLGLSPVPDCPCLFTSDKLIVFFYVDDIAVLYHPSNRSLYQEFRTKFLKAFKMREMGELKWFLGIRVIRDRKARKIWLCQDAYITKICNRFKRPDSSSRRPKTPITAPPPEPYSGDATAEQILQYSQLVGSLTYPASITRPDIAFCTKILAQNLKNPGPQHLTAGYRCVDYLEDTKYLSLEYGGTASLAPIFQAASDAAFADDERTRRSTEGMALMLFGGIFDWLSRLQSTVTTSTTEAELLAVAHLMSWILWWGRFFDNVNLDIDQTLTASCDNLQTIGLLIKDSPRLVTKLKHVDIQQSWMRQEVARGNIQVEWKPTSEMVADGLTKSLTAQKHNDFIKMINMVNVKHLISPDLGGHENSNSESEDLD
jgi:hypothetical protein